MKKIVCRHKSQKKKLVEYVGKKIVVEIDEKYVDQKKHQMVTYIIGKAYDKKILRRNIKKKLLDDDRQKKDCFFSGGRKKKFASNKNSSPPPQICNGASLTSLIISMGSVILFPFLITI